MQIAGSPRLWTDRFRFVFVFVVLHAILFAFGFVNFAVKDNLQIARDTFGPTYMIARSAALVLHVDIALVLFPVCRTLISLARQTPLNGIIQFDKNITFHKQVAWSIVLWSVVHIVARTSTSLSVTSYHHHPSLRPLAWC